MNRFFSQYMELVFENQEDFSNGKSLFISIHFRAQQPTAHVHFCMKTTAANADTTANQVIAQMATLVNKGLGFSASSFVNGLT
jgi:hypothetical protein